MHCCLPYGKIGAITDDGQLTDLSLDAVTGGRDCCLPHFNALCVEHQRHMIGGACAGRCGRPPGPDLGNSDATYGPPSVDGVGYLAAKLPAMPTGWGSER